MLDSSPQITARVTHEVSDLVPAIGLDLDGTIDEAPGFFALLARSWPGKVYILTFRSDRRKTEADLERFGIRYDELHLVSSFDGKAALLVEKGITVYFDDQPEMLKNVPPSVNVMLVRNEGNFDFGDQLWMFSKHTGRMV